MKSVIKLDPVIADTYIIMLSADSKWIYSHQWTDSIKFIHRNLSSVGIKNWKFSNTLDCIVRDRVDG